MGCHLQRNPSQTDVFFHPSMGTRILCNPALPRKPRGQRHLYARASLCAEFLPQRSLCPAPAPTRGHSTLGTLPL